MQLAKYLHVLYAKPSNKVYLFNYPLPLWGFSGIMKQMEHDVVKNPNWYELNQLAILQVWPRI